MKTITSCMVLAVLLCTSLINAQEIIFTQDKEAFATNLVTYETTAFDLQKKPLIAEELKSIDHIVWSIKGISDKVKVSDSYDFFQGLQSPYDPHFWVYLEREQIGGGFRLKSINTAQKTEITLIDEKNSDRSTLAFKPIGWTNHPDEIFVEALYLDAAERHEGIFIYNLSIGAFQNLNIPFKYLATPLLSPDKTRLIFSTTQNKSIDYLHGFSNIIYEYHIPSKTYKTITKVKKGIIKVIGWKQQLDRKSYRNRSNQKSLLSYYLPWDFGKENCVSRHGTPGPTQSHSHVGRCNIFGPGGHHGYAAIDFATSLSRDDNVRASAAGTVSFSGISGSLTSGYGRLVIIRHSDGTRTYYAHNKTLLVSQGQTVQRGQVIAKEGTTGGSTGDHIHFEWRAAGGNASTSGSFVDAGQPRQDYRYRSQNSFGNTTDTQAPTTSISASGGNTQAGDFIANFNDNDNVGVTRKFYQTLEKYGNNWYANRGNGFFNDNFNVLYSGYTTGAGSWGISSGRLRQSNTTSDNTKLSSFLSQNSGLPYLYEFAAKVVSTSGPRKFGIHIMADDVTQSQRGNSYLIWFSGEDNKVRIYETVNNALNFRAIGNVTQDNKWANYKITYSPAYGVLEVFKNNTSILKWTDPSPISRGSSISLRTNKTIVELDDLKVYKFRAGSSQVITAGSAFTKDIRRRNGKIKSLVRDAAGNWSLPGNLDITISSLSKQNLKDDTELIDHSVVLYPNPTDGTKSILQFPSIKGQPTQITVYDIVGRKIKSIPYRGEQNGTINFNLGSYISDLQQGKYIINVVNIQISKSTTLIKE